MAAHSDVQWFEFLFLFGLICYTLGITCGVLLAALLTGRSLRSAGPQATELLASSRWRQIHGGKWRQIDERRQESDMPPTWSPGDKIRGIKPPSGA